MGFPSAEGSKIDEKEHFIISMCDCCEREGVPGVRRSYTDGPRDCEIDEMCDKCIEADCTPGKPCKVVL